MPEQVIILKEGHFLVIACGDHCGLFETRASGKPERTTPLSEPKDFLLLLRKLDNGNRICVMSPTNSVTKLPTQLISGWSARTPRVPLLALSGTQRSSVSIRMTNSQQDTREASMQRACPWTPILRVGHEREQTRIGTVVLTENLFNFTGQEPILTMQISSGELSGQ